MKKKTKKKLLKNLKQKRYIFLIGGVLLLIWIVVVAIYVALHLSGPAEPKHLVTFYDRGAQQAILTHADTVRGALKDAGIKVDSHDIVEPSEDSKLTESYVDVIVYRSRPVAIFDGKLHEIVMTVAQSPNAILKAARLKSLGSKDKTAFRSGDIVTDGASVVLNVERAKIKTVKKIVFKPLPNALTVSKGAQVFVDSNGVAHRETYYDLPMNVVIGACSKGGYKIRSDGAKVDADGYVLVAASYASYPRCTVVQTSLGPGKVYDTGGFAARYPYGFDLATDWTNHDGQ